MPASIIKCDQQIDESTIQLHWIRTYTSLELGKSNHTKSSLHARWHFEARIPVALQFSNNRRRAGRLGKKTRQDKAATGSSFYLHTYVLYSKQSLMPSSMGKWHTRWGNRYKCDEQAVISGFLCLLEPRNQPQHSSVVFISSAIFSHFISVCEAFCYKFISVKRSHFFLLFVFRVWVVQ